MFNLAALLIGAMMIGSGIALMYLRPSSGTSRFKIFGQEVELPTPALVVLVCGTAVFALPFLRPASDPRWTWTQLLPASPERQTLEKTAFDTSFVQEAEPNDSVHEANIFEFGQTVRAEIGQGDQVDFFVTDGPAERFEAVRIILRPTRWDGSRSARVQVFDENEERLADVNVYSDTESFTVDAAQEYIAKIERSISATRMEYELFIGNSR